MWNNWHWFLWTYTIKDGRFLFKNDFHWNWTSFINASNSNASSPPQDTQHHHHDQYHHMPGVLLFLSFQPQKSLSWHSSSSLSSSTWYPVTPELPAHCLPLETLIIIIIKYLVSCYSWAPSPRSPSQDTPRHQTHLQGSSTRGRWGHEDWGGRHGPMRRAGWLTWGCSQMLSCHRRPALGWGPTDHPAGSRGSAGTC